MNPSALKLLLDWPVSDANCAPARVGDLLAAFAAAGHDAYVCGGAVRDRLAGTRINDLDLAVAADLARIRTITEQTLGPGCIRKYLPRFGVLGLGDGGAGIDIAMLRTPDDIGTAKTLADVCYRRIGSLFDDARNRDLTINCGFWSPADGLVDPLECAARDIEERAFGIAAAPQKAAIDPRLSFRCLLFQARGYEMREDARSFVAARLAADMDAHAGDLSTYLHTLLRGSEEMATRLWRAAADLVAPTVAANLQKVCAHVGRS